MIAHHVAHSVVELIEDVNEEYTEIVTDIIPELKIKNENIEQNKFIDTDHHLVQINPLTFDVKVDKFEETGII